MNYLLGHHYQVLFMVAEFLLITTSGVMRLDFGCYHTIRVLYMDKLTRTI